MVGSVLMGRMREDDEFRRIKPFFFSTSAAGQPGPDTGSQPVAPLGDAGRINELAEMDIIVTCQGGDYTREVHPALRRSGWNGYWIDAASALRMATLEGAKTIGLDDCIGSLETGKWADLACIDLNHINSQPVTA